MNREQNSPEGSVPAYYHTVVAGADAATGGRVSGISTVRGWFQKYEATALEGRPNLNADEEVRFLDPEGNVTGDVHAAVGVVVNGMRSRTATLFFREVFCQPLPPAYERPRSLQRGLADNEAIPSSPIMSNVQADAVANGSGYIDRSGQFQRQS